MPGASLRRPIIWLNVVCDKKPAPRTVCENENVTDIITNPVMTSASERLG